MADIITGAADINVLLKLYNLCVPFRFLEILQILDIYKNNMYCYSIYCGH